MKKTKNNNKVAEEAMMPSYRIGEMVAYFGDKKPKFRPAHQIGYHAWFDGFRDLYFTKRSAAESYLAELKGELSRKAKEAEAYVRKTDPELAARMRKHMCTQEDFRLPYYDDVSKANDTILRWEWAHDFTVGKWEEPATVYRLNTLPGEDDKWSKEMVDEIVAKLKWYGHVTVGWRCFGHTRAEWQTDAVEAWAKRTHPEWKVTNLGDECSIER